MVRDHARERIGQGLASAEGKDRTTRINTILDMTRITERLQNALGEGDAASVDVPIGS